MPKSMNKRIKYDRQKIQLRFYEFDSYGIVNNMFCYSWFEMGRFSIAENAGLKSFLTDSCYEIVVCESKAKYLKSIHLTDSVVCLSCINGISGSKITFSHKIVNLNNTVHYIRGNSSVVLLKNGKLMLKYPEEIEKLIIKYINDVQGGFGEE